jgi:Fe2+ or Zn2+ uptake regulation protein
VRTGLSTPTVYSVLASLETLGIVGELTGRERHRVFSYREYLGILSEGTEPTA